MARDAGILIDIFDGFLESALSTAIGSEDIAMDIKNSFEVPLPVSEAWKILLDIKRIAPCMPR